MTGRWLEVVKLAFEGGCFRDHALDLRAITEIGHFQRMVLETAKELWRVAHPDRDRLPKHFEERVRLYLRRIEEGSAVVPLEVCIERPDSSSLFDFEPDIAEVSDAVELARQVFDAVENDRPLPDKFPRSLVPEYAHWGQHLAEDERITIITRKQRSARVTSELPSRLSIYVEAEHKDQVAVEGVVLEADVRKNRFQLWLDEKTCSEVFFTQEQEAEVLNALRDHRLLRLHVEGQGVFSPQGKLEKITRIDTMLAKRPGAAEYDTQARPIEEILRELGQGIPHEEWEKLPSDLTDNLDHYLYGTRKKTREDRLC